MRSLLLRSGAVSVLALLRSPFPVPVPSIFRFTPSGLAWDQVRFKPPLDGRSVENAGVAEDEARDGLEDDMNVVGVSVVVAIVEIAGIVVM